MRACNNLPQPNPFLDIIIACFRRTTFKTKHCIHHIQVHVARPRTAISTIACSVMHEIKSRGIPFVWLPFVLRHMPLHYITEHDACTEGGILLSSVLCSVGCSNFSNMVTTV